MLACATAYRLEHRQRVGSSVLSQKFIEQFEMWGGPRVRGPTLPSALVSRVMAKAGRGVRRGRGRPPHRESYDELLQHASKSEQNNTKVAD